MSENNGRGQGDIERLEDRLRHVELTMANLSSGLDWHVRNCDARAREAGHKLDSVGRAMDMMTNQISAVRDLVGHLESNIQAKMIAALLSCVGGLLIALATVFFHQIFPHAP